MDSIDLSKIKDEIKPPAVDNDYLESREQYLIKDGVEYPEPEYMLSSGGVKTMPKGNLIAVTAKWKNGKTFFCDCIAAIVLGSEMFNEMRTLQPGAKVAFFDTEQAISDTARIKNIIKRMIPVEQHGSLEVYCLRNANIENSDGNELSRYDFIVQTIKMQKPEMVIIDGIADLIYNYNDVIESQSLVNNLAALADEMHCAIVTVMHQNKGKTDNSMKGHIGTMLYQKCSDVFNLRKVERFFVVKHVVSRHRMIDDFAFSLDADGVPCAIDNAAAVGFSEESEIEQRKARMFNEIFAEKDVVSRKDAMQLMMINYGYATPSCYKLLKEWIAEGKVLYIESSKSYKKL